MTAHRYSSLLLCLALVAWPSSAIPEGRPKGITLHVVQEMNLGDLSSVTEGRQHFLPPQNFRLEGTTFLKVLGIKSKVVVVGNGTQVKQLVETPFGLQASTVDLAKVQKALPGYLPASDYDPAAYKKMLDEMPGKKSLPAEVLDGVRTEGYEFSAAGMSLPIPSNMALGLPAPAKVRAWVAPRDGIVRKLEIEDAQQNIIIRMLYTDVKTGVAIPPETFTLVFPDGVKPVDMTPFILKGTAAKETEGSNKGAAGGKP